MRYLPNKFFFAICLLISISSKLLAGTEEAFVKFETELDPYYSNIGWYINFNSKKIPVVNDDKEENIYKKLISDAALPQYMLLEFSIYPLPALGAYIKSEHESFYNDMDIGHDINLIQAFTIGFEEPYALSLFFGSVVRYKRNNENIKNKNKGYLGYLISFGDQHIVNNELIDDHWYEIEWKIKGDLDFKNKILSWSFRIGSKQHEHDNIQDVVYLSFRRNHFNNSKDNWSWINNSDLEYTIELHNETGDLVQQQILVTKKWGLNKENKQALNFGIGLIQQRHKYTGSLAPDEEEYRLIIRSNFQF